MKYWRPMTLIWDEVQLQNGITRYVQYWALIVIVNLFCAHSAPADAPVEAFFVRSGDIAQEVLQDTIGVLTIWISGNFHEISESTTHPANPVFDSGSALFAPDVSHIASYKNSSGTFVSDGTLELAETVVISAIQWSDFLVLRFPIVETQGDYRQIVYDPVQNLRTWINFSEISELLAPLDAPGKPSEINEIYFTEERSPAVRVDIFYLSQRETRKLYQTPEESSNFTIISPASKTLQGSENQVGYYNTLFFYQVRNGFAELWAERGEDLPPKRLGWIKIEDERYRWYYDYFPEGAGETLVDIFFLLGPTATRKLYQTPDEHASFRLISPGVFTESERGHITRIKNGFAFLIDFDYCYAELLRPLGWIKLRDEEHRLTIWPVAPGSCN